MYGLERDYCQAMINALVEANHALLDTDVEGAITASHVPFKGDTLGLDQRPENAIASYLKDYDQYAVIISEERSEDANPLATSSPEAISGARTFFGCDPCDRSNQLRSFLQEMGGEKQKVSEVILHKDARTAWEKMYGGPASITGANAALTCVRRGLPCGTVLLNYVTQEITLACSAGFFHAALPRKHNTGLTFDSLKSKKALSFQRPEPKDFQRFVTFLGKPERGYPQNFTDTNLVSSNDIQENIHYDLPGGPTRILYLTELQGKRKPIGFIVANGEKIGEWIHWLPFIRYSHREDDWGEKALCIFEVTREKTDFRDGYMMAPSENYSVFKPVGDNIVVIDVERLRGLANPSKYRGTLLVTPANNNYVIGRAQQYGYRELNFPTQKQ